MSLFIFFLSICVFKLHWLKDKNVLWQLVTDNSLICTLSKFYVCLHEVKYLCTMCNVCIVFIYIAVKKQSWHPVHRINGHGWIFSARLGILKVMASTLTQTALMSDSCPVNVCLHMLSRMSQSLMEASHAPEINIRESGARDRLITSPLWPENTVVCCPVSISHNALQTHVR